MLVTITGYAFYEDIEKGGDGMKFGSFRVQVAHVAKNMQQGTVCNAGGNIKY